MSGFREIKEAALSVAEARMLDRGQIPDGFGATLYKSLLSETQRAALSREGKTLYVRKGADPAIFDGSLALPFSTRQAALDKIAALGDASATNPYIIDVGPGVFTGQIIPRVGHTTIRGAGVDKTIFEVPTTGPPVWLTNATLASIAAVEDADGHITGTALDTAYGDLIADPAVASIAGFRIEGVTIERRNTTEPAIVAVGVGNEFDAGAAAFELVGSLCNGAVYLRNLPQAAVRRSRVFFTSDIRQCSILTLENAELRALYMDHNLTDDRPGDTSYLLEQQGCKFGSAFSISGVVQAFSYDAPYIQGTVILEDSAKLTAYGLNAKALTLDGDVTVTLYGGHIREDATVQNPGTLSLTADDLYVGGDFDIEAGGTKTITTKNLAVQGTVTDPDDSISNTAAAFPVVVSSSSSSVDLDFTADATVDIKDGGNGNYSLGGYTWAADNVAAATSADITLGTGLVMQAASNQRLIADAGTLLAPQWNIALSTLLASLPGASEMAGLRIWCRMLIADEVSAGENVGFGLISSGADPARLISIRKNVGGIYMDHHAPASDGAATLVSADNTPDVLVLEKAPGIDLWAVRTGAWGSDWPTLANTTLLGYVALSTPSTTPSLGAALTKFADLDLTLYISNEQVTPAPDYDHIQSDGDRTLTVVPTTTLTTSLGDIADTVNGLSTTSDNSWRPSGDVAGKEVRFDFGTPVICDQIKHHNSGFSYTYGTWKVQGSGNGDDWTDLSADFEWTQALNPQYPGDISANVTPYRYYRLLGVSGTINANVYTREFDFRLDAAYTVSAAATSTHKNVKIEPF